MNKKQRCFSTRGALVAALFIGASIIGAAITAASAQPTPSFRGPSKPSDALVKLTQLSGDPVWISPPESACVRTPVQYDLSFLDPPSNHKKGRKASDQLGPSIKSNWAKAKTEICSHDSRNTFVQESPEEVAERLGMKVFFHTPDGKSKVWLNHKDISIVRAARGNSVDGARTEACMHDTRCFYFSEEPNEVAEKLNDALSD